MLLGWIFVGFPLTLSAFYRAGVTRGGPWVAWNVLYQMDHVRT